jgi:hypothetical protein
MTELSDKERRHVRRRSIVSFAIFFVALAVAVYGWYRLQHEPKIWGQPKMLRNALQVNQEVNAASFDTAHKVKEYPVGEAAKKPRVNGDLGMGDFDAGNWKLLVFPHDARDTTLALGMNLDQIKALRKRDLIFEFKCIEGWSQKTHWGGVRFSDFLKRYKLGTHSGRAPDPGHPEDLYKYVGLMTPDGKYYVGIDMKSMLHPQTLLAYEMNGKPLPMEQGYPLRLIIPIKYGIKSLKRIGFIYFSDTPPPDYWYRYGYDYDAAL